MTRSLGSFKVSPQRAEPVTFSFTFWRSDQAGDDFTFQAIPVSDPLQIAKINRLAHSKSAKDALRLMDALTASVRRMLDDSDGTPADWYPAAAPDRKELTADTDPIEWPSATEGELSPSQVDIPEEDNPADDEGRFVAPDGSLRPWSEQGDFEAFEAGSSLRRWRALWSDDNEYMVPVEQLLQTWRALSAAAGKGPTAR